MIKEISVLYSIEDEEKLYKEVEKLDTLIDLSREDVYILAWELIEFCKRYEKRVYIRKIHYLLYEKYKSMGFNKHLNFFEEKNIKNSKKQPRGHILKNIVRQLRS